MKKLPALSVLRGLGSYALIPLLALAALGLSGCSSSPDKPKPAELGPVAALINVSPVWSAQVGSSHAMLVPRAVSGRIYVAGGGGTVLALEALSGRPIWRVDLGVPIAAGVGSDGRLAAVITLDNELVVIDEGKEIWRTRLPARAFTAPLVTGRRVFVLTADRTVRAFDGFNGAALWTQSRVAEPLVLSQPGVLLTVGETLVAGLSARLVGLNPLDGTVRWDAAAAVPKGANEVERLNDIVGPASRVGGGVCVRAYAAVITCIDTTRPAVVWSKPSQGATGIHGDADFVFSTESDGRVVAWLRLNGQQAWQTQRLKHRDLTAPLALERVVAVGDEQGVVHLLSRQDGSEMNRLTTDAGAILAPPVLWDDVLVVQTAKGGIYAWRPQ